MRDPWLDLLRAAAIAAVVVYHTVQMSPVPLALHRVTRFGALGVDLFFVLSGFLIGSLYWKEQKAHGQIELVRFWQRRWWRTLPAYYVALGLAWGAVFVARREPFDPLYLVFLQNYEHVLPFFLVSWSLCIEEHFYLFLPPLLLAGEALRVPRVLLFALLIPSSTVLRYFEARDGLSGQFGFEATATHLHLDGLLLGFALSGLFVHAPARAQQAQRIARWVVAPLVLLAAYCAAHPDPRLSYVLTGAAVALAMSAALIAGVAMTGVGSLARTGLLATSVMQLALISYSVYLTHPLAIHVARAISARLQLGVPGYFVIAPALILAGGALFYRLIEKPSLGLRDRIAPRRPAEA
jgi:peptidoglycan/LPS O-acetylase OafA/YrhL